MIFFNFDVNFHEKRANTQNEMQALRFFSVLRVFALLIKVQKFGHEFFTLMLVFQSKARKHPKLDASFKKFLSFTRLCAFEKVQKFGHVFFMEYSAVLSTHITSYVHIYWKNQFSS
jgi:hypothetical protein